MLRKRQVEVLAEVDHVREPEACHVRDYRASTVIRVIQLHVRLRLSQPLRHEFEQGYDVRVGLYGHVYICVHKMTHTYIGIR